ncbi:MAG: hypothetical protein DIZ80_01685 [endosymbiont of Galathealinum brachiosum]|uniref:histidine kinase n=1 Tax=endosymbiont of Galathealinum brachiosum TaxID=2200906 RepID=A0A370DL64_9GAMM|nr:MAG: hypothetical protein DIZ80_01685 [endosymbiont of Galathealinum brachiosum]
MKKKSKNILPLSMAAVTLLLVFLTFISVHYADRMVSKYSTLVASAIEVKQELTVAHLWFEEIMSGDRNEDINTVWFHIRHAETFLHAIDNGVENNAINLKLVTVEKKLQAFREITRIRYNSFENSGVGSKIDQQYDASFINLLHDIDIIIFDIKTLIESDQTFFNLIQKALIILIIFSGIIVGFLLYFYQNNLFIALQDQQSINHELSNNKQRFQDIALCGGDWIWEVNSLGIYTYASENVSNILGYSSNEIIGKTPFDLMSSNESKRVSSYFKELVENHEKITDLDNWNIHKNGEHVYLRTNGVPIINDNGDLTGYRGVDKDITEFKTMNDLLLRTQKMDALGKLTGGIAHDFNNMLGVIIGYSELLLNIPSNNEKSEEYLTEIIKAGNRSKKLTSKLLTFSRKSIFSSEITDINKLLNNVRHMLEKTLTARITLNYDLEDNLWPSWIDKSSLEDAILNMSINAMHAIEDIGLLTVKTRNLSLNENEVKALDLTPGDYIAISISDTGCGMDEQTLQKIFDPFYTTKGEKGIGLGLSQLYGFVQQSKGGVQVTSKINEGSEFIIYLPRYLYSTSEDNPDLVTPDKNLPSSSKIISGHETVLVVDDEDSLRLLVEEILLSNGYKVLTANNAEQALKTLETEHVDLLLSDVIMPGMSGYKLASIVKEKYPDIKIQMASGYSDSNSIRNYDENLHKNKLDKPYNIKKLLQRIREEFD